MKFLNSFENVSIGAALVTAITNVSEYITFFIIAVQAVLILAKIIVFIYNCAKKKTTDNIVVQIAEAVNELDQLKEEVKNNAN